ncbi:ATP-binding protein [Methylobacterium sp. AMS5]|uniref:ATP-binding protein n=1 Tax=Methylobacterium sp. AMS5 TaxID=925818 RepID=UPI00074F9CC0|nr:ATP-binding protein [Methylobacterium sp. AMS5]AMB48343.1 hypothetical protein Y590_25580 [Methylobacterium sp. AMS5]
MQVTHVTEPDSHVIIGGGKTHAFQVKASAAAFKIMSDSLYRDKERAAVREIVCNAIDAHAMVGKESEPVKVTLSDDELIVEDQGPGIADDRIADIYCTLFASTKEGQDNQTGGFGLGSKAPFAISDHFTVISRHQGISTLYAMHVGDPTTNGTPGAKVMMKSRTDGTGLTVSVPLAVGMRDKIESALKQVVQEGGMVVDLNGERLSAPDYTELKRNGFGLGYLSRRNIAKVQVLYANVLYPLDTHEELQAYISRLRDMTFNNRSFIIYAPPSSISVTPSREALSYNDQTVGTLKKVLAGVVGRCQGRVNHYLKGFLKEAYKDAKRNKLPAEKVYIEAQNENEKLLTGIEAIARGYALYVMSNRGFSEREQAKIFLGTMKHRRRGLRQIASHKHGRGFSFERDATEYAKRSVARLATKADVLKLLHIKVTQREKPIAANKPDRDRTYSFHGRWRKPRIFLAQNKIEARKAERGYILIGKLKESQRKVILEQGKKLGIEVIDLKPAVKVIPEAEKPKEQFGPPCPPRFIKLSWDQYRDRETYSKDDITLYATRECHVSPRIFMPAAYFGVKATSVDYKPAFYLTRQPPNAHLVLDLIKKHIGEVAMIWKRSDMDFLQGQNIPRLETLVLEKLRARLALNKPYEALYVKLALLASNPSKMGSELAGMMIAHSRRFAHAAVREPYTDDADRDDAWTWWLMAKTVLHQRWASSDHLDKSESTEILKLVEEYRNIVCELEATGFKDGSLFRPASSTWDCWKSSTSRSSS